MRSTASSTLPDWPRRSAPEGVWSSSTGGRIPQTWEGGPPAEVRVSKEQAAASLAPYFAATLLEDLGPSMFAVVATLTPRR